LLHIKFFNAFLLLYSRLFLHLVKYPLKGRVVITILSGSGEIPAGALLEPIPVILYSRNFKLIMKQTFLLFFTISACFIVAGQSNKVKRIDSLMRAANEIGVFNGNVLIAMDKKIIYRAEIGYADTTKTKSLRPELRLAIGSITKEFNSVGVIMLREKHNLSLNDKVSKYLPELPKWADKIQIKNLLQYTSGLPQSAAESDSEYLQSLMKLEKLEFEPGTSYNYSNDNVFLQREVIKKVTDLSYKEFIKKYIFKPLKMDAVLIDASTTNPYIAQSFDNDYNETTTSQGKNELYLTIDDLYKWSEAINTYKLIDKKSTLELSESFNGKESSLGEAKFDNDKFKLHIHQGSGNNYEALLYSNPEDNLTILLMTNNQNFKVHQLKDAIVHILNDRPYIVHKKSIYLDIRKKLLNDFNQGIAFYNQIKSTQKNKYDLDGEVFDLYNTGKYLMRRNRFDDAIKIFYLSTILDLKNSGGISYAFTLIGECYFKSGSKEMAAIYYKKALELDATNKTAEGMLKEISREK